MDNTHRELTLDGNRVIGFDNPVPKHPRYYLINEFQIEAINNTLDRAKLILAGLFEADIPEPEVNKAYKESREDVV